MKIVTGYRGIAHITSGDVGAFNASVFGDGQYVLGNGLNATVVSNNQIRIGEGDILMNGRHITIDKGTSEDLVFENNQASSNRIDLVVCRYTKNTGSGVESAELVIIKGTATTGTPSVPSYNQGNILNGDEIVDMPLYKVQFNGITMGTPFAMFEIMDSAVDVKKLLTRDIEIMGDDLSSYVSKQLATKANSSHTHDDRYYTETEVNTKLASKANSSHNHDSSYYTKTASDAKYMLPVGTTILHHNQASNGSPVPYGTWECRGYVRLTSSNGSTYEPYIWYRKA